MKQLTFRSVLLILLALTSSLVVSLKEKFAIELSKWRQDELNLIVRCVRNVSETYLGGRNIVFLTEQIVGDLSETLVSNLNHGMKVITSVDNVSANLGFYVFFQNNNPNGNREDYNSYEDVLQKLPPNNIMRFVLVWDFQRKIDLRQVQKVLEEFWSYKIIDVIVLMPFSASKNIRIYTYYPFSSTRCGEAGPPILINVWNSHRQSFVSEDTNLFARYKKVFNLHGCPLRCVGIHRPPESTITRTAGGGSTSSWKLSGTGVKVFQFIERYMNFTAIISTFHKAEQEQHSGGGNSRNAVNSTAADFSGAARRQNMPVAVDDFDIAFGKFTRVLDGEPDVDFITENQVDCFTWAVPHGIGRQPSIWRNYVVEFSPVSWCIIGVSIVLAAIVIKFIITIQYRISNNSNSRLGHIGFALFFTFSTFVGATVKLKSRHPLLRLFVSQWLFYSLVLMSGYQAYLGSLMTIPQTEPEINRQSDLMNTDGLNLVGRREMFYVLNESTSTSIEFGNLMSRFFILTPVHFDQVIDRMIKKRDIAVFTSKRELIYYAQRRKKRHNNNNNNNSNDHTSKIHVFTDCIIKSYSAAFMLRKGSPYQFPINNVLMRLFETGIYNHWDTDNVKDEIEHNIYFTKDTMLILRELYGAFVVLFIGSGLSMLIFFAEVFNHLMKSNTTSSTFYFTNRIDNSEMI